MTSTADNAPPQIPLRQKRPLSGRLMEVATVLGVAALLFLFSPSEYSFYPICLFHRITGWLCPGCGGLRATHALLHGDWLAAFRLNPVLVASLPVLAVFWLKRLFGKENARGNGCAFSTRMLWLIIAIVVLFGVLRNLPPLRHIGLNTLS